MDLHPPQSAVLWGQPETSTEITCTQCGSQFDVPAWQPRIRCPHCRTVGYPDRSGRNLLSLDWDCLSCSAKNPGSVNFCLNCGTGLSSRCLRCEYPVYTAICNHCGTHQDHVKHYSQAEVRRMAWVPDLHEQIRQQRLREEIDRTRNFNPGYGVTEWRKIDTSMRDAVRKRRERHDKVRAARKARRKPVIGWLILLLGAGWLIGSNLDVITPVVTQWMSGIHVTLPDLTTWVSSLVPPDFSSATAPYIAWLEDWLVALAASVRNPITQDDPEYAYVFAFVVFGMAAVPILIHLLSRIIRKLLS